MAKMKRFRARYPGRCQCGCGAHVSKGDALAVRYVLVSCAERVQERPEAEREPVQVPGRRIVSDGPVRDDLNDHEREPVQAPTVKRPRLLPARLAPVDDDGARLPEISSRPSTAERPTITARAAGGGGGLFDGLVSGGDA